MHHVICKLDMKKRTSNFKFPEALFAAFRFINAELCYQHHWFYGDLFVDKEKRQIIVLGIKYFDLF